MADQEVRSVNFVPALLAQDSLNTRNAVALWADKTTHRLLVDAGTITTSSATAGATGAAVPSSADYIGVSSGGTLVGLALGQTTMALSLPVTIASNQASIPVAATLSAETTKVIGTVNISASQTVGLVAGSAIVGKFTTDQTTHGTTDLVASDITKVGGAAVTLGSKTSANSFPVVIASDQGAVPVSESGTWTVQPGNTPNSTPWLTTDSATAAPAASVPSKASYGGVNGQTSLPAAVTTGQLVGLFGDKYGRQVALIGTIRDLRGTQTTTISASTSETTVVTAGGAGVFNDLVMLLFSNTSATAVRIDIRDTTAGTVLGSVYLPAGDMRGFSIASESIPQTGANTNWTAQCSASVTDVRVYAVFNKNK